MLLSHNDITNGSQLEKNILYSKDIEKEPKIKEICFLYLR